MSTGFANEGTKGVPAFLLLAGRQRLWKITPKKEEEGGCFRLIFMGGKEMKLTDSTKFERAALGLHETYTKVLII